MSVFVLLYLYEYKKTKESKRKGCHWFIIICDEPGQG